MDHFGEIIRNFRLENKLPLRTVSAFLDIDQAILSKIERGQRNASRNVVNKLAEYFKTDRDKLLLAWLSDSLYYQLEDEEKAIEALQVAEEKLMYKRNRSIDLGSIIQTIRDYLKKDGRVSQAWLFGSFARGEVRSGSDIDLMIKYSEKASGTLFDYADINHQLEALLQLKVDLVEEGYIKSFAEESINRDKVLIYG